MPTSRRRYLEVALLFAGLVGVCMIAASTGRNDWPSRFVPDAAAVPALGNAQAWLARDGYRDRGRHFSRHLERGSWARTIHGLGSPEENARSIQFFLIAMAIPFLFLGAVIEERGTAEERFMKAFRCSPDAMWITRLRDGLAPRRQRAMGKALRVSAARRSLGGRRMISNLWTNPAERAEMVSKVKDGAGARARSLVAQQGW